MPRKPTVHWDKRAKAWTSSSLGELRKTKTGRWYRTKVFNREIDKDDLLSAQAWLHGELKKERERRVTAADLTFEQLTEFYLQAQEGSLAKDTYDRRVEHLNRFGNWPAPDSPARMDLHRARLITAMQVNEYAQTMLKEGLSESYVADALVKAIKTVFSWAASPESGRYPGLPLPKNPIAGLKSPLKPRRAHREVTGKQVDALLAWMRSRAEAMPHDEDGTPKRKARLALNSVILVETLRATGARPKELCAAEWSEWTVYADGWGLINLPWQKWKNGWKTKRERHISVPPEQAARIEWIRDLPGRHPTHIFVHRNMDEGKDDAAALAGVPWVADARNDNTKALQKWFNRIVKLACKAGVDIPNNLRLYWLRSVYATEAQRKGVPQARVAHAMGTSPPMLDRHYTDMDAKDAMETAKAIRGEKGKHKGK
jgi:integrase